jgi:NAD(P)-dependent dehydrogenase (short-subunit alcohol dehydrogenase family)
MEHLAGRVAVLTGAGSGIGQGTAHALARRGVDVVVTDVDADRASRVADEVTGLGAKGVGLRVDVTDEGQLEAARDLALERFGRIDVVMNNVGVLAGGYPQDIPIAAWERILDINVMGVVKSLKVFLPLLLERGDGHIVNTASTAGLYAYAYDRMPYAASKGAIVTLTESLALYARQHGIGVTLLCPGPTATNIMEQITTYGDNPPPLRSPGLSMHTAAEVGEMVADAIEHDRYFLPTNGDEVVQILRRRADDVDAFVTAQVAHMASPPTDPVPPSSMTAAASEREPTR